MRGKRSFRTMALVGIALGTAPAAASVETGRYFVSKDQGCGLTHIDRQRQSFVSCEKDFALGYHVFEFGHEDRDARQGTARYNIALGSRSFSQEMIGEWIG